MKKCLLILLLVVCFIFAGCSDVGIVGMAQNSDGSILEFYSIPYAEAELLSAGLTAQENIKIKAQAKEKLDEVFTGYINAYKDRIDANESYSDAQKEYLKNGVSFDSSFNDDESALQTDATNQVITNIQYELNFKNSTCFLEFKNANELLKQPKTVVEFKSLLTTTTKVIKDPVFDNIAMESITLGNYVVGVIDGIVLNVLSGDNPTTDQITIAKQRWEAIKLATNYKNASQTFVYCYIVPTARVKSNADQISVKDGYYYHFWKVSADNAGKPEEEQVHLEYWTTTANKAVWYGFAVGGAVIVMLIVYFKSRKQDNAKVDTNNQIGE